VTGHIFLAYLAIFAPVFTVAMAGGLFLGWHACRWLRKGPTVEQIVAGQDAGAEWARIWQDVTDYLEGK
jgi:hypothetical protein